MEDDKLKDYYMMMFGCYVVRDGKVFDPSKIRIITIKKTWPLSKHSPKQ